MAAKLSYCRAVTVFVVAVCAVASAFPFQPSQDEYLTQHEHDGASTAEHGDDDAAASHGGPVPKPGSTYHFQYSVHDPLTGDEKSQNEVGDGHGSVKGSYSLVEADGSTRVVEYTADDVHGFRAEVKRIEAPAHRQHLHDQSVTTAAAATADADTPSYKFDFAAENAAARAAASAQPAADYELQQSLHYNYPLQQQQHQPELHFSSSHRR
ncbi:cuticle protein 8-like [Rhopalosiphum maidis]|uniref:cuticle protein 8-like n=1 Tax=Rhopalosiphum maidis TaxID=43146 RepID=UPI000F00714E|nr:cuticle protein 8-like [Rhopalosiphum maidis]